MARHAFARVAAAGVMAVVVTACADNSTTSSAPVSEGRSLSVAELSGGRSIIIGANGRLPADLEAQVTAAGGTVTGTLPEIGVAFASNVGAAQLSGVESVAADLTLTYEQPARTFDMSADDAGAPASQVVSLADNEPLYRYQWAPASVQAPEAWNAGRTGRGVRVAVLDGGLFDTHPDLAAGVDVAASRSFITGAFNTDVGTFWHGTHVAGIIGARDNGLGVIGIAPNATLIGVKVLHNGSGSFSALLNGIVYAATPQAQGGAGAQVINMSLGAYIENAKESPAVKAEVRELTKAIDRAMRYANTQGTTVIAAAGNDGSNLDVNRFDLNVPGMSARVIGVAATAPLGWAYGNTDFARQASYTNFGKAAVTFAAPGGDFAWPTNELCTLTGNTRACWVFDMYLSTSRAGYTWAAGTSMATPVVAGVAALIIEANGGTLEPAQVKAKLAQGALDLGKPGFDALYGHGFVNALQSVQK